MLSAKRIEWIDITKGIAIFLMVCGHTSIPKSISDFIWSFHMPLFFIVSGILYKPEKAENCMVYAISKFYSLIVPYFFFLLCDYIYRISWGLDISWNMLTDGINVGAYWFIQVLLIVELTNALLIKFWYNLFSNTTAWGGYLFSILTLALLGYWTSVNHIHFPYRIEVTGLASLHYGIGFLSSNYLKKWKVNTYCSLLFLILTFAIAQFLPRLDMNINQFGSFIPNFMLAWLGTFSVMMISKTIEEWEYNNLAKRFLLWVGQFSIVVMGLSQPINMSLKYTLEMIGIPRIIAIFIQHSLLWFILIGVSLMLNQYAPLLIGKKI